MRDLREPERLDIRNDKKFSHSTPTRNPQPATAELKTYAETIKESS